MTGTTPTRNPQTAEETRRLIAVLRGHTWDQVEHFYRNGYHGIGQVEWEAFGYAWRRGAFHHSSLGQGYEHPVDEEVRQLGNAIMGDDAPGTCPCPDGANCTR